MTMTTSTITREADADHRFAASVLEAFIADAMVAVGLPAADAAAVGRLMTEADLTGADAHGIFRLPQYVRRIRAGGVNVAPRISVERTAAATALVDGDNGMGHLVVSRAAETAIELARDAGVAWVGVRRSNHAGTAGLYAAMPVPHGMIGLYAAVANANHMAVWGGSELLLGTNPLGIAVPSGAGPVVLDMATTVVSYGTVKKYALAGRDMPEGWLIDTQTGGTLTDPKRSAEGLLLPIGGYKGAGLAIMLGLLGGVLNGAAFGRDVIDFNVRPGRRHQYRAFHGGGRYQALRAARHLHGRDRPPPRRPARLAAAARRRSHPPAGRPPPRLPRRTVARRGAAAGGAGGATRQTGGRFGARRLASGASKMTKGTIKLCLPLQRDD